MNLAKEMKKKRDAEKRLEHNSPTTIFIEGGGGEKSYNDYSNFATKKQLADGLDEKAEIEHTHKFIDLEDSPINYVGQAGKVTKVNATEDGLEFGEGGSGGELIQATETVLGGIRAKEKTTESSEVAIDVLTGKLYAPAPSGGGATSIISDLWLVPPHLAQPFSTNTDRTQGSQFICSTNGWITKAFTRISAVANETYRFRLYELDGLAIATIVSQIGTEYDVKALSSGAQILATGIINWPIVSGKRYALLVTRVGATTCQLCYGQSIAFSNFAYTATLINGVRTSLLTPTGVLTVPTDTYAVGFTATNGDA